MCVALLGLSFVVPCAMALKEFKFKSRSKSEESKTANINFEHLFPGVNKVIRESDNSSKKHGKWKGAKDVMQPLIRSYIIRLINKEIQPKQDFV